MHLKSNYNKGNNACTTIGLEAVKHGTRIIAQLHKNKCVDISNISATAQHNLDSKKSSEMKILIMVKGWQKTYGLLCCIRCTYERKITKV